ncbi:hypothetical protein FOL46_000488 [Perkinsus olseni]|uniref:Uncharacterized protein n=1 Tax=Perkinsus olseni TaxID=32597 RepID=A0A7J6MWW9_PEROL|nr:hypothetical protein FOL46_000488 [Perkinsus olseni]
MSGEYCLTTATTQKAPAWSTTRGLTIAEGLPASSRAQAPANDKRENKSLRSEMSEHKRTRSFKKMQEDIDRQDVIIRALTARVGVQESKNIIAEALSRGPPRARSKSRQELLFELEEARRLVREAHKSATLRAPETAAAGSNYSSELMGKLRDDLERARRGEANARAELELAKEALGATERSNYLSDRSRHPVTTTRLDSPIGALDSGGAELARFERDTQSLQRQLEQEAKKSQALEAEVVRLRSLVSHTTSGHIASSLISRHWNKSDQPLRPGR